jgi:hypothetical protein
MVRLDATTYRLRRFRVALVAVLALPWIIDLLLAPFFGWHMSALRAAIFLLVDGVLVFSAWRNPAGIASIVVILRLSGAAALWLLWSRATGVGRAYGVVLAVCAVLLIALLVPMWLPLRRQRMQSQLARVDAKASNPDRQALKRQAKIEQRGYL